MCLSPFSHELNKRDALKQFKRCFKDSEGYKTFSVQQNIYVQLCFERCLHHSFHTFLVSTIQATSSAIVMYLCKIVRLLRAVFIHLKCRHPGNEFHQNPCYNKCQSSIVRNG